MALLEALVVASEKAANIARICRQNEHLFELLVQRKDEEECNPRYVQDFKTLADVLIQETVRHDLGRKFPVFKNHVKGEESNKFCNKLGETITVEIQNGPKATADLLEVVLNGDADAARLLAEEVHKDVALEEVDTLRDLPKFFLECQDLGIWIDPIDSTAEYISGKEVEGYNGIFLNGLRCVTVLIGVYDRKSGNPIIGIVNQPFHEQKQQRWRGRCFWGLSTSSLSASSLRGPSRTSSAKIACLSTSEDEAVKQPLRKADFVLVEASGAGYKILTVILGQADVYVLSKDTTFKWDTCGPQAILRSLGGDVVGLGDALDGETKGVDYLEGSAEGSKIEKCCNGGGIVAYRDGKVCREVVELLGKGAGSK